MKKFLSVFIALCFCYGSVYAENSLVIGPDDIRLEKKDNGGFHLYIRKKAGIESVLLTETTKDPDGQEDNYAYRAEEYNEINGDEIRYLDGKVLDSKWARHSLIDSTEEADDVFGNAFHIYIPLVLQYGYPWTRNGTVKIDKGTFVNIRTFSKKYGDYTGDYMDNPFMFDLVPPPVEKPAINTTEELVPDTKPVPETEVETEADIPVLTDDYSPIAASKFEELTDMLRFSKPDTLVNDIISIIDDIPAGKDVDIVFAIDATGSMLDDIEQLRIELLPHLIDSLSRFNRSRLGLLLYRDYVDSWRYKGLPVKYFAFTEDLSQFKTNLNAFTIKGNEGGDIPEAVYEAMYGALEFYKWDKDAVHRIILIGDAEPHPHPRGTGKFTKELVMSLSEKRGVPITAIILPDDKTRRGR